VIEQKNGDDSPCANMVAQGNGKITCNPPATKKP
jgi:hypothetical protein